MNACVENAAPALLATSNKPPETPVQAANRAVIAAAGTDMDTPETRVWFPARWLGCSSARTAKRSPHIVHVDVDAFFASVEQVLNPKLAGKPVLVGRCVVASASYEAKFRGVKTAMNFRDALSICPTAIVVPEQYEHYADFAERVRRILESYAPAVETSSRDDFYLDFSGTERLYPDYEETLRRMQTEILERTGLNVSIGAARTRVVASIASRLERPRGFRIVEPGMEEAFLAPLPVDRLHRIGHMQAESLAASGVSTIGQLRTVPKPVLVAAYGDAIGKQIWAGARGLDGREVMPASKSKSVSREMTIEGGTIDTEFLGGMLEYLSERIGSTLRDYGKQANTAGVRLEYVDRFSAHQSVKLICPTHDKGELLVAAKTLFCTLFTRRMAIRQIGVAVTSVDLGRRPSEWFETDTNRYGYFNRKPDRLIGQNGWGAVVNEKRVELQGSVAIR